jgi:hypothetical protein
MATSPRGQRIKHMETAPQTSPQHRLVTTSLQRVKKVRPRRKAPHRTQCPRTCTCNSSMTNDRGTHPYPCGHIPLSGLTISCMRRPMHQHLEGSTTSKQDILQHDTAAQCAPTTNSRAFTTGMVCVSCQLPPLPPAGPVSSPRPLRTLTSARPEQRRRPPFRSDGSPSAGRP